jgi:hypothetical protein
MITILNSHRAAWSAFIILAVCYFITASGYSINIPYPDDFHQQINTAIQLEQGADVTASLFRQHNVHRLFTTHIVTYIEHAITGKVNLNNQLFVALLLIIALVLVITSFSHRKHWPAVLLITSLLLLSPELSATWVGGTTQYYALILFSLLSLKWLYFIEKPWSLLGSIIAMFLAIYSMIGGILVPIVGLVYLLVSRKIMRPRSLIWLGSSVIFLIAYFSSYESHQNQPSVWFFLQDPGFTFEFTFRMLSNFLSDLVEANLLWNLGLMVFAGFLLMLIRSRLIIDFLASPEGLAFFYVLLMIGSVVVGRVGFQEQVGAYADRYFVFTKTLWLLGLIILLNRRLVSENALVFILGMSTMYMLATYQNESRNLAQHQQAHCDAMVDYLVRGNATGFEFANQPDMAGALIKKAMGLGVYTPGLLATRSREVKYLSYSDFTDGLEATVVRDKRVGGFRYFAFSVDNATQVHEVALVPRGVYGPAFLLQAAALVEPSRLPPDERASRIYQVVIDTSKLNNSLTYDVFLISLGMITTIGEI